MAYVVLARKWRPQTFDEVIGQDHVSRTLKRALELGRWGHAYLFSGPRGVGKTTVARILAKALNCDQGPSAEPCNSCPTCEDIAASRGMDVLEIDGASHRGIDEIRTLRENVRYAPTKGKHKVYIIDEVHMLTTEAFNALLKTLEEPPPKVVFVFATTEPHKVPATIASRCQRFEFRKVPSTLIKARLSSIAQAEEFSISNEALGLIARRADGSVRDAEVLLDQAVAFADAEVAPSDLEELLGMTGEESMCLLLTSILNHDGRELLTLLDRLLQSGTDPGQLVQGFSNYLRDILHAKVGAETDSLGTMPNEYLARLREAGAGVEEEDLIAMLALWAPLQRELRTSPHPRLALELAGLRLAKREGRATVKEVLERLGRAEEAILGQGRYEGEEEDSEAPSGPAGLGAESNSSPEEPRIPPVTARQGTPTVPETGCPPEPGVLEATPPPVDVLWPSVLEELRKHSKGLAALLVGTKLARVGSAQYRILFPERHRFHLEQVQKEDNLDAVVQALAKKVGEPVSISCVLERGLSVDEPEEAPVDSNEGVPDPVVRKVIDLFQGDFLGYEKRASEGRDEP